MIDSECTYSDRREELLITYAYEEMAPPERVEFEAHVATCEVCRTELAALDSVKARLAEWAPPELARPSTPSAQAPWRRPSGGWATLQAMPAWAQVAAAVLVVGVSAGAANLRVTYNTDGLSVRTGWLASPGQGEGGAQPLTPLEAPVEPPATRAELAAVTRELRGEIEAARIANPDLVGQMRSLIAASERRQENELALGMATLARDLSAQRRADFARMDRTLGVLSSAAGQEVLQVRRQADEMYRTLARFQQKQ
ncbi:MAG: hypothetical protein EXQ59_01605 [Acidobacteria bacterium]|nr:hypothetical protein [Acidobacteriota bacterium]